LHQQVYYRNLHWI